MRISYNDYVPFLTFENDQINIDTIEGNAIETFIEKHNLTTEWKYENFKWGNKDENGTFNGVIGRVIIKKIIPWFEKKYLSRKYLDLSNLF